MLKGMFAGLFFLLVSLAASIAAAEMAAMILSRQVEVADWWTIASVLARPCSAARRRA